MPDVQSIYESVRNGAPAPPVDREDLKRVWQLIRIAQKKAVGTSASREAGGTSGQPHVGIAADRVAEHCGPGANSSVVFFRCQMLGMLLKQGLLAPWQHGEDIDEFLFHVFASYPLHVGSFDVEALLRHIREKQQS